MNHKPDDSRDEDQNRHPSRTMQHWLWALLLMLGLPAAGLTIAVMLAHAPPRDCKTRPGDGVIGLFLCRGAR